MDKLGINEPDWTTQDQIHVYTEDGTHYERFSGPQGQIYAAVDGNIDTQIRWVLLTADEWNTLVDEATEVSGLDLYR